MLEQMTQGLRVGEFVSVFKGKTLTEEWKDKIRKHHLENGTQKGENNSQYGTCWLTKDGKNIKVKDNEADRYLSQGWKYGREVFVTSLNLSLEEIKELRNDKGITWKEIARLCGVDKNTLRKYLERHDMLKFLKKDVRNDA